VYGQGRSYHGQNNGSQKPQAPKVVKEFKGDDEIVSDKAKHSASKNEEEVKTSNLQSKKSNTTSLKSRRDDSRKGSQSSVFKSRHK